MNELENFINEMQNYLCNIKEPPFGRWLTLKEYYEKYNISRPDHREPVVYCSCCESPNNRKTKYCPNCGVLMEGKND